MGRLFAELRISIMNRSGKNSFQEKKRSSIQECHLYLRNIIQISEFRTVYISSRASFGSGFLILLYPPTTIPYVFGKLIVLRIQKIKFRTFFLVSMVTISKSICLKSPKKSWLLHSKSLELRFFFKLFDSRFKIFLDLAVIVMCEPIESL